MSDSTEMTVTLQLSHRTATLIKNLAKATKQTPDAIIEMMVDTVASDMNPHILMAPKQEKS